MSSDPTSELTEEQKDSVLAMLVLSLIVGTHPSYRQRRMFRTAMECAGRSKASARHGLGLVVALQQKMWETQVLRARVTQCCVTRCVCCMSMKLTPSQALPAASPGASVLHSHATSPSLYPSLSPSGPERTRPLRMYFIRRPPSPRPNDRELSGLVHGGYLLRCDLVWRGRYKQVSTVAVTYSDMSGSKHSLFYSSVIPSPLTGHYCRFGKKPRGGFDPTRSQDEATALVVIPSGREALFDSNSR
jgi:hypothetical protein